jgi:hypothetical protein
MSSPSCRQTNRAAVEGPAASDAKPQTSLGARLAQSSSIAILFNCMHAAPPDRSCDPRHSAARRQSLSRRMGGVVRIGRKRGGGPQWRMEYGNEHCRKTIRGAPRRFCRSERKNVLGDMHLRRDPRRSAGHLCSGVGNSAESPRSQPFADQSPGRDVGRRSLKIGPRASPYFMHPPLPEF